MKTKISRIGKKSLSVIIALMMIVSTMLVGMVSTNAATSVTLYFASDTTETLKIKVSNGSAEREITLTKVDGATQEGKQVYKTTECTSDDKWLHLIIGSKYYYNKINNETFSNYDNKIFIISNSSSGEGSWQSYSGGTSSTSYYIGGRFRVKDSLDNYVYTYGSSGNWNASSTTGFELTDADNDGTYSLNTNCTIKELSEKLPESGTQYDPFFFIHTGKGVGTGNVWYGKTSAVLTDTTTSITLDDKTGANTDSANGLIMFSGSSSEGSVIINFTPSTKTLSYTIEGGSPSGNYKLADKSGNYGKVVFTVGGKVVTSANENDEVTATVTPNTGFEYVADSFSVTNDTSKEAVGTPTGTTLTFTMPASDVTATAKFALNKAEYVKTLEDGLYVDVAPDKNDTTATFVMWNNYTGVGQDAPSSGYAAHNTKDYYTLYIPANVDLGSVTLYNAFSSDGLKMSIRRLWVLISNCSRLYLYL